MPKLLGVSEVHPTGRNSVIVYFEINYNDASGTYAIAPLAANQHVINGGTVVKTVFDGSPTLTIGDDADVDGYADNTDVALGTAATATVPAVKLFSNNGNPYANGKFYTTANTVDAVWTKDAAGTTGKLIGWVEIGDVGTASEIVF